MKLRQHQTGFAPLELVLVLVAVTLVGFVAFSVYNTNQTATEPKVASDVPTAPSISSITDLTQAEKTLEEISPDASVNDSAELDTHLSTF